MSKNKGLNPGHMLIFAIIILLLILSHIFIFNRSASCKKEINAYHLQGLSNIMQGVFSSETLSDRQVERKKEWNKKNYEFMGRDRNGDGILTGEEIETEF